MFESQKVIFFNFSANEMVNFVYKYESGFWEQYCIAWNRFYPRVWKRFSHIESAPFHAKTKMPSRCTFRLKFEKRLSYFKWKHSNFPKPKLLCNQKTFIFGTKNASFGIFKIQFWIFWINTPKFFKRQSFIEKYKSVNLESKNALFENF